jgi:cytidylate kinase
VSRPRVIAIDGPAGAGKGTLARLLATKLGYAHLDTGLIYRAVAARLLAAHGDPHDPKQAAAMARALDPADLDRPDLRSAEVTEAASVVAANPDVRAALLDFQREFAATPPGGAAGAVLDGRDVGTVVCPDAELKLYVTASREVRAERRFRELQSAGQSINKARVLADIRARDARDQGRAAAPLKPAADAIELDTTEMTIEDVLAKALEIVRETEAG